VIVAVVGTDTDVGKTFVSAAVVRALRARGIEVAARKPVQSFASGDTATDADVLAAASGESPDTVCPLHRWIPLAMAPPIAAEQLGNPAFTIGDLVSELAVAERGITIVESVGGVRSPVAADGDSLALVDEIHPALIVLVADAGLGTINAVLLSLAALGPRPVVVFLNRFDPADTVHVSNRAWLRAREDLATVTDVDDLAATLSALLH